MKNLLAVAFLSVLFFACQTEAQYSDDELKGVWNAYSINTNGDVQEVNTGKVRFEFTDEAYSYKGGAHQEEGVWNIKGNLIETQVDDLLKKQVEIVQLANDTLIIKMNDNGIPMSMSFTKE